MLDEYFAGYESSRSLFEAVRRVIDAIGPADLQISKSQIAFRRRKAFAWVWVPERYLHRQAAPLVLTLGRRERDPSPRWKQIVEPVPDRFTHHLELHSSEELDDEVCGWLREAWRDAG